MNRILVFGTFDGLHDGHRAMLREAKALALSLRAPAKQSSKNEKLWIASSTRNDSQGYLIVAVAADDVVMGLKGAMPRHSGAARIAMIKAERIADEVLLGDAEINSWKILKKCKPSVIALGYDQHELRQSLEAHLEEAYPDVETEEGPPDNEDGRVNWRKIPKKPRLVILSSHKPEIHHNRIIRKK